MIWEIFTGGKRPYDNWASVDVIENVLAGKRLEKPENCPSPLYELLLKMWAKEAKDRPSISEIGTSLQDIIQNQ